MAQHKTGDAVASLVRKRRLEGDRQYALANSVQPAFAAPPPTLRIERSGGAPSSRSLR